MKTVILLRHSKSVQASGYMRDFERPLELQGKKDAPEMGRRLVQRGILPSRVISSPSVRTRETAEAIAVAIGFPIPSIVWDAAIYEATSDILLRVLRNQPDTSQCLMVIGHNPGLTHLANSLTDDHLEDLPTSGTYILSLPTEQWLRTEPGTGVRISIDAPGLSTDTH